MSAALDRPDENTRLGNVQIDARVEAGQVRSLRGSRVDMVPPTSSLTRPILVLSLGSQPEPCQPTD